MLTLVTGATGLVGNNVVRLLLERGQKVRALTRPTSDSRPLAGLNVERFSGDVTDRDSIMRAVRGVDGVIHAAGQVTWGWSGMDLQRRVNIGGTRNVAEAALAEGVRMVHVSTVSALGAGTREAPADEQTAPVGMLPCPYTFTKVGAEYVVLDLVSLGLKACIVSPVFMLGAWDWKPSSGRMLLEVAKAKFLRAPPGGNDFTDVRDVAAGVLTALKRGLPGRRYILGGEALSFLEIWTLMREVTGKSPPHGEFHKSVIRVAGQFGDLYAKITGREPDVNSAASWSGCTQQHYSYARAAKELDYHPGPVREAARLAWKWFKENGYA